ncbi:sensor histidine kinase [Baaleninema sp.]|uniref:sensor histidine kinase n=1 Tax=Baaleninema sp. TaxID=3101197 RepID=UPI003CFDBE70
MTRTATLVASLISIAAFVGTFGDYAQAYAPFMALGIAFVLSPILAIATGGKYYIARENPYANPNFHLNFNPNFHFNSQRDTSPTQIQIHDFQPQTVQTLDGRDLMTCCICEQSYEPADMAYCPVYGGSICSLCCSLDSRCHDRCKPELDFIKNPLFEKLQAAFREKISPHLDAKLIRFLGSFALVVGVTVAIFLLVYFFSITSVREQFPHQSVELSEVLFAAFVELYAPLLVILGIAAWWYVLSEDSRELAEDELDKQNQQLQREILDRTAAEEALQQLTHDLENRVKQRTFELSRALKTLKETQSQLVQTEKMSGLGQLVAGVAHEINNPVNFIYGNLVHAEEYIQDILDLVALYEEKCNASDPEIEAKIEEIEFEFISEDLLKLLKSMKVGSQRIREIVLSLRNFSRLDESDVKPVDLHEGIDSSLMILGNRLKGKGDRSAIEVVKNYGDLPPVECYAGSINQVFMNILTNAVDALEEFRTAKEKSGEPCQIRIETQANETHVRICIEDNGSGIPETVKPKIFDPFFTTKPIGKGTGLGMSISYQIVTEKHGGQLRCDSEIDRGTRFVIELPIFTQRTSHR